MLLLSAPAGAPFLCSYIGSGHDLLKSGSPETGQMARSGYQVPGSPGYLMSLMMLNIGMYSAMTAAPTAPPMIAIRTGSMREVSASTEAETSEL